MKLCDITFSYECKGRSARITYIQPRKSLVFEWLVLEILSVAQSHEEYSESSLSDILATVFHVNAAEEIIKVCLQNLLDLNAITSTNYDDHFPLKEFKCTDFSLTKQGFEMHKQGKLPGKNTNTFKVFYKDYFTSEVFTSEKLDSKNFYTRNPDSNGIVFAKDGEIVFSPMDIKTYAENTKLFSPETEILDIIIPEKDSISFQEDAMYKNIRACLNLSNNMEVTVSCKEDVQTENVMQKIFENFLPNVEEETSLPELQFEDLENSVKEIFLGTDEKLKEKTEKHIDNCMKEQKSFIIDYSIFGDKIIKELTKKYSSNKKKEHLIIYNNAKDFKYISVTKSSPIHKIYLDENIFDDAKTFLNSDLSLNLGQVRIHSGELQKNIPLGYEQKEEKNVLTEIVTRIVEKHENEVKKITDVLKLFDIEKDDVKNNKTNKKQNDSKQYNDISEKQKCKYKNIYIIDTNILMENLEDFKIVFKKFKDTQVIFPTPILEELDKQKQKNREKAQPAILFISETEKIEYVSFENSYNENLPQELQNNSMDNLILSIAIERQNNFDAKVFLITNDKNLRNKARSQKINTKNIKELQNDMKQQNK